MATDISSHTIDSPLVEGARAELVGVIDSELIISRYSTEYGIDVSDYFINVQHVSVYECQATHYKFYHPFSLTGRESLYRELEKFDWNYKTEKWEYTQAINYIPKAARVLDVGCGRGAFVKIAARAGFRSHGLELNASAVAFAVGEGLSVSAELIGDHAMRFPETYDAVCSFQVLEHIPDVRQFINDCMRALKPGGSFIIGVPNNDSFLQYDSGAALNVPPHHMGLWSSKSLSALQNVFPIILKNIEVEPLAEVEWYASVMERRYLTRKWIRSAYYRLGFSRMFKRYVASQTKRIPGHTILAIFEKQ